MDSISKAQVVKKESIKSLLVRGLARELHGMLASDDASVGIRTYMLLVANGAYAPRETPLTLQSSKRQPVGSSVGFRHSSEPAPELKFRSPSTPTSRSLTQHSVREARCCPCNE